MFTKIHKVLGAAALAALIPTSALASSHREAPAISNDPAADNTDLYAWVTPTTHDKLIILANYIPLEEPAGGPNFNSFSDDVRYTVDIFKGNDIHNEFATYNIDFHTTHTRGDPGAPGRFPTGQNPFTGVNFFSQIGGDTQTYTVTRIAQNGSRQVIASNVPVAPPNIGPRTEAVVHGGAPYDDAFTQTFVKTGTDGTRVFAGPREDGFYVDLGGIFDLANLRANGVAQDGVAGFNTHTIALEIPLTTIFGNTLPTVSADNVILGVYASAARRKVTVLKNNGERDTDGPFVRVSRLGQPLINEAVIGLQDKDRWNATEPKDDVPKFGGYFDNPIIVRDAVAVGIYNQATVDAGAFDRNRAADILGVISLAGGFGGRTLTDLGDVLRIDPTRDSAYPNGRALQGATDVLGNPRANDQEAGDVTDIELSLLLFKLSAGVNVSDGVQHNDKPFKPNFPFLAEPFRGFEQGHGKITAP